MNWAPLHLHSWFSLLDGIGNPEQIAKRVNELGYKSCALTDHGGVSGAVAFSKACKKEGVKPILGNEFYLSKLKADIHTQENRKHSHLVVLSKNLEGWKGLLKATSASNSPENFYYRARLSLPELASFAQSNWIVHSGHAGSDLGDVIFKGKIREAYSARSYDEAKSFASTTWKEDATALINQYRDLFGKENFYLEVQLVDSDNIPATTIISKALRYLGKRLGVPCVGTADSHYVLKEDAPDQRVVLCSAFRTTMKEVQRKISADEDVSLGAFFRSNNYHIPSLDELKVHHVGDELENALRIADLCESYSILNKPFLPKFDTGEVSQEQYLKDLCVKGWKEKIDSLPREKHEVYRDRIRHELSVLNGVGLAGYFLVVHDYVKWGRDQGWLICNRGSGAGCLVSYLLGISEIDPIKYDLIFERFFNIGRMSPDKISLPDCDLDYPTEKREMVIEYMRNKYGRDKTAQVATFSSLQGRGAIKEVLRAHSACGIEEMNRITSCIPPESAISDKLEEMAQAGENPSSIQWSLEHLGKDLEEWVQLEDDGTLSGDYARYFEQAMRLEGVKKSRSRHAAALILAPEPLEDLCPMGFDKNSGETIAMMEFTALEEMGLPKFDFLGVRSLSRMMKTVELIRSN